MTAAGKTLRFFFGAVALASLAMLALVAGGVTAYYVKAYQIEYACQKGNSP